jgi:hypothetical protein
LVTRTTTPFGCSDNCWRFDDTNDVDDDIIKLLSPQSSSSLSSSSLLLLPTNLDMFTSDNGEDAINAATRADAGDDGTCVSGIEVVIRTFQIFEATSAACYCLSYP